MKSKAKEQELVILRFDRKQQWGTFEKEGMYNGNKLGEVKGNIKICCSCLNCSLCVFNYFPLGIRGHL